MKTPLALLAAAVMLAPLSPPAARAASLDLKAEQIELIDPQTSVTAKELTLEEGSTVGIICHWSVNIVNPDGYWKSDKGLQWEDLVQVDGKTIKVLTASTPGGIELGSKGGGSATWLDKLTGAGEPFKTALPKKITGKHYAAVWTTQGVGPHEAKCVINHASQVSDNSVANNVAIAVINVVAKKPAAAPPAPKTPTAKSEWQSAAAAPQMAAPGGPQLPKPSLSIVGVQSKVDPACQNIHHVFTAAVSIRNSSVPLAAGKGTVFAKETGGASLGSAGVPLPAFAANETKVVEVPVGTLASFAPALPGQHQLAVNLSPVLESGQPTFTKPASPYPLAVSFPSGYCQAQPERVPPARTTKPVPGSQLPAVQQPPAPTRRVDPPRQ